MGSANARNSHRLSRGNSKYGASNSKRNGADIGSDFVSESSSDDALIRNNNDSDL